MSEHDDNGPRFRARDLVSAAVKGGVKAVSGARDAWRSEGARRIRGGVKTAVAGLVGVTRFVKANTLRGLLNGEILISEADLNRFMERVDKPDQVTGMSVRCRPSRLVLVLEFERRLLGVKVAKATVDLPFEIMSVRINGEGGTVELRLDKNAQTPARGFLRPIMLRLLSRAASELLEGKGQLELDDYEDVISREGDTFTIDVGAFPPFIELMSRELRLPGGRRILPFRAFVVDRAIVEEGQLVVRVKLDRDRLTTEQVEVFVEGEEEVVVLEAEDEEEVEVTILYSSRARVDEEEADDDDE